MKLWLFLALAASLWGPTAARAADPVNVVAAENFYGDIARQIGGSDVKVTSILSNPDEDPHLFEASPSVARAIAAARIVVSNGVDYDPWMDKLLAASHATNRKSIVVAQLAGRKIGDNPHVWYDLDATRAYAGALTEALAADDSADAGGFRQRLAQFQNSLAPIKAKISALRGRLAGTPVTATEPIFGYMFDALGMKSRNQAFQLAVMNDTEPSPSDVAAFENDLKTHAVKLLLYNSQASDPTADRMKSIAEAAGVPIVGATETEPKGKTYQQWMTDEIDAVDKALPAGAP